MSAPLRRGIMSNLTVLVIEDEALIRLDIVSHLEDAGFDVLDGPDGAVARRLFDAQPDAVNAVITDIRLGHGENGWDVARHCRQVNPTLPVVYMSGDSAGDWSAQGVPESIMIPKPFVMAQIITALSMLLNQLGAKAADASPIE